MEANKTLDVKLQAIADRMGALTLKTRKGLLYIGRSARKWGKDKGLKTVTAIVDAMETEFALCKVTLDKSTLNKAFTVFREAKRADKKGVFEAWCNATTDSAAHALLGHDGKAPSSKKTTTLQRWQKAVAACVKKNDAFTLQELKTVVESALKILEAKTAPRKSDAASGPMAPAKVKKVKTVAPEVVAPEVVAPEVKAPEVVNVPCAAN